MTDESNNRLRVLGEVFPTGQRPDDPSVITARADDFLDIIRILAIRGQCPVIFGPKGIGKSTLAWQVEAFMKKDGEARVISALNGIDEAPDRYYETFWLTCSSLRHLNGSAVLAAIAERLRRKQDKIEEESQRKRGEFLESYSSDTRIVAQPIGPNYQLLNEHEPSVASVGEEILNLAMKVSARCDAPLLFILDDLDAVDDTIVLTSFLKNACWTSPEDLRFVLAGTAVGPGALLEGLSHLDGIYKPIELKRMSDSEILTMLTRKADLLSKKDLRLEFNPGVLNAIATISAGHPSTAVQLALDSIRTAEGLKEFFISREHLDTALRKLVGALSASAPVRRHRQVDNLGRS